MVKIKHIIRYFVEFYPHQDELSKTRLTKMVYLADWSSSLRNGCQLTNINWYFDHYGPYIVDVYNEVSKDPRLTIVNEMNRYGSPKQTIKLKDTPFDFIYRYKLSDETIDILDDVINSTKKMYWSEFIDYVYNTYPIKNSNKYSFLNLEELAIRCKQQGYTI